MDKTIQWHDIDTEWNQYGSMIDLQKMFGACADEEEKEKCIMKKCEVCLPDGNGKVSIGLGCVFISPTTTGFMLYSNPEGDVEIHAFGDIDSLLTYMGDNKLMDLTQTIVANNI